MRLVVVSFIGLWATACDPSPEQEARDVCTAVCQCQSASPAQVDACTAECVSEVPTPLPDGCIDCIYQYSQSCADLSARCSDVCQPPQPQPNLSESGGTQ